MFQSRAEMVTYDGFGPGPSSDWSGEFGERHSTVEPHLHQAVRRQLMNRGFDRGTCTPRSDAAILDGCNNTSVIERHELTLAF